MVEAHRNHALAADVEGAEGGHARPRLVDPHQRVVWTLADVLRHAAERRGTRRRRPTLPDTHAFHSQCHGQRFPRLRFGSRDTRHELHERGALAAEVREIDPQGAEEAGPTQPSPCAANIRGGSQVVTAERDSMPGPKFNVTATGFPSCSSNFVGTNHDEMPGPVAMACQTSSGVPGTSTSTWMERRPEGSFFTLMMTPWDWIYDAPHPARSFCSPPVSRRVF